MTRSPLRRRLPLVASALVGALVLSGCEAYDLPLPGSPVSKDDSIEITAEFADVLNLVPRSPVLVNDVTVGEVTDLERDGWNAVATLRIQDDVELPANTIAKIQQTSLLGEKYVSLEPGPGAPVGRLEDGATLALSDTGRNPELEEVLGSLAFLLNGGGVGKLKTITTEINAVFDGRQDRVKNVLSELDTLVGGLDDQRDDIIGAMESLNGLARTLNQEKSTVTAALDELGPAVQILADQEDDLVRMLAALDKLGRVGTRVVNATKEDLLKTLASLRPVLREIAAAGDQLPTALSLLISFPFPIESNNIVYGDYANTEIVFSVDLNNLPGFGGESAGGEPLDLSGITDLLTGQGKKGSKGGGVEEQLADLLGGLTSIPGLPGLAGRLGTPAPGTAGDLTSLMGGEQS